MPVPSLIGNHTERAYDRLLGQFKDKPLIEALLKSWTDVYQELEQDAYDVMMKTLFLTGDKNNLSRYGELFGIPYPEGMSTTEYREILITEILRRSSDGTPDRIRQILEATTGITRTRFFEHYNGLQKPYVMGCNFVYGYDLNGTAAISLNSNEARIVQKASPVTTGSAVLGIHTGQESTLFIPSEVVSPLQKLGLSSTKVLNGSFDEDLSGWTTDGNQVWDTATQSMYVTANGAIVTTYTSLDNLEVGQTYILSAQHTAANGDQSTFKVGTSVGDDSLGSVTATDEESVALSFTATSVSHTLTIDSNINLSSTFEAYIDLVEVYNIIAGYDQDELVDQVDNWIAIRGVSSDIYSEGYENGILPEFENQIERFQVDTSLTDEGLPASSVGVQDFSVDTESGIEEFNIEYRNLDRPSNNRGIMLEISQVTLKESF